MEWIGGKKEIIVKTDEFYIKLHIFAARLKLNYSKF